MAMSKKRSLSDMQANAAPAAPRITDDNTYREVVLKIDQTEDEIDHDLQQTALELGISHPQNPPSPIESATNGLSALDINIQPSEALEQQPPTPLRASHSIHTASDSSIEQPRHRKTPSLAATSITSASLSSVASNKSNISRVRKSFRRISRFQRKRSTGGSVPDIPPRVSSMLQVQRPEMPQSRPATADHVPTITHLQPHAITTDQMHPLEKPRRLMSISYDLTISPPPNAAPPPPPPPLSRPEEPEEDTLEYITARRRSISNPTLRNLRTTQLQEQLRFISYEATQQRLLRTRQLQQKRDALSQYQEKQEETNASHAEALTSLENRHLTAEDELHRALETERQACDTRLKHMQAYCNPRSNVQGMPNRVVTKSDYRQLEQQYHTRNGMNNLHSSRVNVLRERQARQLERIMAKQETELENLEAGFKRQNEEIDARFRAEESQLQHEFAERKNRLTERWNIAEAIERKRLEVQSGEEHGALPTITWSPRRPSTAVSGVSPVSDERKSSFVSSHSFFPLPSRDGQPLDAESVREALNMI